MCLKGAFGRCLREVLQVDLKALLCPRILCFRRNLLSEKVLLISGIVLSSLKYVIRGSAEF